MSLLKLNCLGIEIHRQKSAIGGAFAYSLTSDMKADTACAEFNSAADALEALGLAPHCEGVKVDDVGYVNGLTDVYEALCNRFDSDSQSCKKMALALHLWGDLSNVIVEDELIQQAFLHFPVNTPVYDIWHWFEDVFGLVSGDTVV